MISCAAQVFETARVRRCVRRRAGSANPVSYTHLDAVGVANGLAWTSVGGEILPIEVQTVPGGAGRLELTLSLIHI